MAGATLKLSGVKRKREVVWIWHRGMKMASLQDVPLPAADSKPLVKSPGMRRVRSTDDLLPVDSMDLQLPAPSSASASDPIFPFEELLKSEFPFDNVAEERPLSLRIICDDEKYPDASYKKAFAELALVHFNTKEGTDFNLVEVLAYGFDFLFPTYIIHLNFIAELSTSENPSLFYAEVETPEITEVVPETEIMSCSKIEFLEQGNTLGVRCQICGPNVRHPGPRGGYRILAGDRLENSNLWLYGSCVLDRRRVEELTRDGMEMFVACAQKAVKYLNDKKKGGSWEVLTVLAGLDVICGGKIIIHLNFTVKSRTISYSQLCFAELQLPLFDCDAPGVWVAEKTQFLEVCGCCIMSIDNGNRNPFGRVCSLCSSETLIHPGPLYGYKVIFGDQFKFHVFQIPGQGVF